MSALIRDIYPVGHGGFAIEKIGNFTVVFDCGAKNKKTIRKAIDYSGIDDIDIIIISHYDRDHVNGLEYLLEGRHIGKIYIPYVPEEIQIVYDHFTDGCYSRIHSLLRQKNTEVLPIQDSHNQYSRDRFWLWNITSMITSDDWDRLKHKFKLFDLRIDSFDDPAYVETHLPLINKSFKDSGFSQGSNGKGLVMLSRHAPEHSVDSVVEYGGVEVHKEGSERVSGCLYLGDADLNDQNSINRVKELVSHNKLLLAQIPHHGSNRNSNYKYIKAVSAFWYFYCDCSDFRISKNEIYVHLVDNDLLSANSTNGIHCSIDVH